MRKTGFLLICLATILSGCAAERAASTANSSNSNSAYNVTSAKNTSTYDTSASNSPAVSQNTSANMMTNSSGAVADERKNTVQRQHISVGQQVSLVKAEQVTESEYNIDRKIVRNAELDLEATSPEQAQEKITSIAEMKGGFVVESNQSMSDIKADNRDIVTMTLRVPSDKFGESLDEVRKTSSRVISETVKGEDVTEEYIDVEAQLKAKKALEAQFMEIMKRAVRVEEAMEVQSELADVRGEIEKIEGRKRFLENKSSLSTIKIRLQTAQVIASTTHGFGERFVDAFDAGMSVATNFLLGLMTIVVAVLPFALIVGLPGIFLFRYFWRRQAGPKSVSEIARDEID
jgi:hypothetical protein